LFYLKNSFLQELIQKNKKFRLIIFILTIKIQLKESKANKLFGTQS